MEDATAPGHGHYIQHRKRGEEPCPKSRAEHNWATAEKRAGHPLPDYRYRQRRPRRTDWECGTTEQAEEPDNRHYEWHRRRGEEPCPKSRAEKGHHEAIRRGRGDGYRYKPHGKPHKCGTAEQAGEPNKAHAEWHRRRGETPCPKALAERGHHEAIREGRAEGYKYSGREQRGEWECGTTEQAEEPNAGHYHWHYIRGEEPCPKSRAEKGHYQAGRKGRAEGYEYGGGWPDGETALYEIRFGDGDYYIGISADPDYRWEQHYQADTLLGEKMRAGVMFSAEVIAT